MSALKSAVFTIATLCLVTTASAQSNCSGSHCDDGQRNHHDGHLHHGYIGTYGYGYSYRPTWSEGYLRGKADLVRSQGMANLLNAQAWTQAEEARARNLENKVLALNTYHERRRINTETRFGHLHAKAVERKADQAQFVSTALDNGIDPRRPVGLSPAELNRRTGELNWPLLLQTEHFARARGSVDHFFAMRAKFDGINPDHYIPFRNWIERIKAELHLSVNTLPKEDYAAAQDFLRRIIAEVKLPAHPLPPATQLVAK